MASVLILSYYYPPCTGVPAYRPFSWSKDLPSHQIKTTVITRHWTGKEKKWEDFLEENLTEKTETESQNCKIIHLPYKQDHSYILSHRNWMRILGLNKILQVLLAMQGKFQADINAYGCFKETVFEQLKKNKYDLLIVTSPPLNLVKLAYEANRLTGIPFVVDFQDLWNNIMLAENYSPSLKERFFNRYKQNYLKKWLKSASFISAVTPSFKELIQKVCDRPVEIITNGFDNEQYDQNIRPSSDHFNISLMGTVHPIQDISVMLEGLVLFLKEKDPQKVKLNFIGLRSNKEMEEKIKNALPERFIHISDRIQIDEAAKLTLAAHVLLFPSYKGYKGYYTAKIFEYLGARRNILMAPGNNDIVDELIVQTRSGKVVNTANEFSKALDNWYSEWQNNSTLIYHGVEDKIMFYTRQNQNKLFQAAIKKWIK